MSTSWPLAVELRPAILVVPPDVESLDEAHAAIELWEHYSRKVLDPSQRLVVEMMMAQTAAGLWAAATTGREMPRQQGKGDEVEVVELWGLVQRAEAILHTVHDAVLLASQAQQRMLAVLERHGDLRRKVKRKWLGTGQQMIEMHNGGVVWYRTRTNGGGRGVDDVARLVVDEAQHATEEHLAAVSPTLLANPNPQMNVLGTAGISGKSDWWWSQRKRALGPNPGAFGYVGHTAETVSLDIEGRVIQQPVDAEDRSLWPEANPSLVAGRGQGLPFLEEQLRRLGPASFAREHLCVWDAPTDESGSDIDLTAWASLEHLEDERPNPVALAVQVSEDRQWTYIGLAGHRRDGHAHLQIVESLPGTSAVASRLIELQRAWSPVGVALHPGGPSGSLVPALEQAKVDITSVWDREVAAADAGFLDAVKQQSVHHSSQPVLNIALRAARKQPRGQAWVWRSNEPGTDIAPLKAVSLALFMLAKAPRPQSFVPRRIR